MNFPASMLASLLEEFKRACAQAFLLISYQARADTTIVPESVPTERLGLGVSKQLCLMDSREVEAFVEVLLQLPFISHLKGSFSCRTGGF